MGGQKGGMTNEVGKFPEICKKSIQAQLTDIQQAIPRDLFRKNTIKDLQAMRPRDLAQSGRLNTPLFCANNSDRYVPIEWKEALNKVTKSLSDVSPDGTFFIVLDDLPMKRPFYCSYSSGLMVPIILIIVLITAIRLQALD